MLREFRQLLAELFPSERLQQYYFPFGWTRSSYNAFVHGDEGNNNYCPYPRSDSLRTDFSTALPKVSEKDQLLHDLKELWKLKRQYRLYQILSRDRAFASKLFEAV